MKPRFKVICNRPVSEKPRLRYVWPETMLEKAIKWLRSRNLYILDQGSRKPGWGIPGTMKGIK